MSVMTDILNKVAPNKRLSTFIAIGGIVLVGLIIGLWIMPQADKLTAMDEELFSVAARSRTMQAQIRQTETIQKDYQQALITLTTYSKQGIITPLLNSYAMRVKSMLDPLATKHTLAITHVRESLRITLPIPPKTPVPKQLYVRQPVECQGIGTFMNLVKFIADIEKTYPLTVLTGISVSAQDKDPINQTFTLTLEWPCLGERTDVKLDPK